LRLLIDLSKPLRDIIKALKGKGLRTPLRAVSKALRRTKAVEGLNTALKGPYPYQRLQGFKALSKFLEGLTKACIRP
jgi:hypothetical protein